MCLKGYPQFAFGCMVLAIEYFRMHERLDSTWSQGQIDHSKGELCFSSTFNESIKSHSEKLFWSGHLEGPQRLALALNLVPKVK